MTLKLTKAVLESLPAPDGKGVIRVSVGLKVKEDGEASLLEMNDVPMPMGDKGDAPEEPEEVADETDEMKATAENMPAPQEMEAGLYT